MSSFNSKAVALRYEGSDSAPVIVASGLGYMAQKIIEVAAENNVPVYEDNSLATVLSQFQLGQEIPEELYQAIVDIYIYFLKFDPNSRLGERQAAAELSAQVPGEEQPAPEPAQPGEAPLS